MKNTHNVLAICKWENPRREIRNISFAFRETERMSERKKKSESLGKKMLDTLF